MGAKHLYEFGPFRLDPAERRLLRDGQPVALTPKCFDLLGEHSQVGWRQGQREALLDSLV